MIKATVLNILNTPNPSAQNPQGFQLPKLLHIPPHPRPQTLTPEALYSKSYQTLNLSPSTLNPTKP